MASRVEHYASLALTLGGKRFLLISHPDCFATTLACASVNQSDTGQCHLRVLQVEYSGYVVLRRQITGLSRAEDAALIQPSSGWQLYHKGVGARCRRKELASSRSAFRRHCRRAFRCSYCCEHSSRSPLC